MERATVSREGDDFRYQWPNDLQIILRGVRESGGDITAIVSVQYVNGTAESLMAPSRLNLVAPQSRKAMATLLTGRRAMVGMAAEDWTDAIEQACGRTYALWERGEPFVDLSEVEPPEGGLSYLLDPLVIEGETALWVADGGSGKSTYAVAAVLSLMTCREVIPGMRPARRVSGLYLDWESNKNEVKRRLRGLARGAGTDPPPLVYRSLYRAFVDEIGEVRREVDRHGHGVVVVDSAVPASGGDVKDTEAPKLLFNALRTLGAAGRVVLAHMSKSEADRETGRARALGSIMYENLARSVWELRASDHGGDYELVVGFYHRKQNGGRLRKPFCLRIVYGADEQPERIERADLRDYPDLEDRIRPGDRLKDALTRRAHSTTEVARLLGKSNEATTKLLLRHPTVIQLSPGGGRGNPATWGWLTPEEVPDDAEKVTKDSDDWWTQQ